MKTSTAVVWASILAPLALVVSVVGLVAWLFAGGTETVAKKWELVGCRETEMDDLKVCAALSPPAIVSGGLQILSAIKYECIESGGRFVNSNDRMYVSLGFDYLNLVNPSKRSGRFAYYNLRFRWDNELAHETLFSAEVGGKALHWYENLPRTEAIRRFQKHKKFRIELDYYSHGNIVFAYSLDGAASAIASARAKCGIPE